MENNKNELIELLEKQLSNNLKAYSEFKSSEKNERYFNNLHFQAMKRVDAKESKMIFHYTPTIGYAMLFVISFMVSIQLFNFNGQETVSEINYLFSETSLWIEEEAYLSNNINDDINLDYANYFNNEINYSSSNYFNDDLNQLSESEFEEIYNNIKNKKIL